tara:strand:- start:4161 stop:4604 length:444 start_codon:yes stop_codon:yes gene_type:complete
MGKLLGIATRMKSKSPMDEHASATVSFESGVLNDYRGKKIGGKRQVTVMSKEAWEIVCKELGSDIAWTTRRANFLIEGILLEGTNGQILKIGSLELEITGELVPCNRMDEQFDGLTKILEQSWRGGVTCKVRKEGDANLNDEVFLVS